MKKLEMAKEIDLKDKKNRKNMIKNFTIVFLVIMLLLTFFSNTIMNITLPEVEIKSLNSGTITSAIQGTGTAATIKNYNVTLEQPREIDQVNISLGDEVKTGDVLFTLTETENEELETAKKELEVLKTEYETGLLDVSLPSYAADNEEARALKEALTLAIKERSKLGSTTMTLTQAQTVVDHAQYNVDVWTEKVEQTQNKITQITNNDSAYSEIRSEVTALETATTNMNKSQSDYDNLVSANGGKDHLTIAEEIKTLENTIAGLEDGDDKQKAQNSLEALKISYEALYSAFETLKVDKEIVSEYSVALENKKAAEKSMLLSELDQYQNSLENAKSTLLNAQADYNTVKNIKDAETAVTEARNNLNLKLAALADQQGLDEIAKEKAVITSEDQVRQISEKEAEIKEMEEKLIGTEVKAECNGVVTSVNAVPGAAVLAGDILAVIDIRDTGFESEFSVSSENANNLSIGQEVMVTSTVSSGLSAVISNIRNDLESSGKQKIITVRIDGDVTIGETLSFSISLKSEKYTYVVPKSAVNQDASGYFVYTIQTSSTPLGNRYKAVKTAVRILDSDDSFAAIEGVSANDYIIQTSTAPIEDGDYVRMSN